MPNIYKLHNSLSSLHEDTLTEIMDMPAMSPPSRGALYDFCALGLSPVALEEDALTLRSFFALTSAIREDERIRVWASTEAVCPPSPRLNKFIWSDVSPPSVIWERMCLLVFATLFGVLLDAGRCKLETAGAL